MKRILFLIMIFVLGTTNAWAWSQGAYVRKGNVLFKKGDFSQALKAYQEALKKEPESPILNYNAGTAYYKLKDWDRAIPSFEKALLSPDDKIKKDSHYNLGNAYYQRANAKENIDPQAALNDIQKSKEHFESVLKMDDKDSDARYNYEAAVKKEEEIKKKIKKMPVTKKKGTDKDKAYEDSSQAQPQPDEGAGSNDQDQKQESPPDQNEQHKAEQAQEQEQAQHDPGKEKSDQQNTSDHKADKQEQSQSSVYSSGEMTKEEAKQLLKQFEQNEQPEGLLKMNKSFGREKPVLKDW